MGAYRKTISAIPRIMKPAFDFATASKFKAGVGTI
jgi:hypothetical protein